MSYRIGLLILTSFSVVLMAQNRPDFSGVFLRTTVESKKNHIDTPLPIILEIKQNGKRLEVIAYQHDRTITNNYSLGGKSTNRTPTGFPVERRAQVKGNLLVTKSTVKFSGRKQQFILSEKWHLSQDSQQLTIQQRSEYTNAVTSGVPVQQTEYYARQQSLEAALRALSVAPPFKCPDLAVPGARNEGKQTYEDSAAIGAVPYHEGMRSVFLSADVSGPFLKGLKSVRHDGATEFARNGVAVLNYPDSVTLEIQPRSLLCKTKWDSNWDPLPLGIWAAWIPLWPMPSKAPPLDPDLSELRFQIRWVGSVEKDLGEVPSELITEMWPEFGTPTTFYRLNISGQQIPLTDSLEIQILSKDGQPLANIAGHI